MVSDAQIYAENDLSIYPNPVVVNELFVKGKKIGNIKNASIVDLSGKLIHQETAPFKNKNSINVQKLNPGVYILKVDDQSVKFIKK